MKKNLILSIIYLLCVNLNAQLLYEISGNGLTKSSYLFGTHHMVPVETATKIEGENSFMLRRTYLNPSQNVTLAPQ